jgi:DNA-binding protein YbaB
MDDRVLTPDDARQRLEAWKGRIDKLAADTQAMSDRFQQLQVTTKDQNGMTEVTVDSSGALVGLKLTKEIERASPDVVAATIMSTIREAKAEVAHRSQEIIAETVGTESPAARAIAERVGQHLLGSRGSEDTDDTDDGVRFAVDEDDGDDEPPAASAPVERPPGRPVRRAAEDDDEDNNDLNIWR